MRRTRPLMRNAMSVTRSMRTSTRAGQHCILALIFALSSTAVALHPATAQEAAPAAEQPDQPAAETALPPVVVMGSEEPKPTAKTKKKTKRIAGKPKSAASPAAAPAPNPDQTYT